MNTRTAFQYSVLRYFHDLTTGEFQNVGLALYSKEGNFFRAQVLTKYRRITHAFPGTDGEYFRKYMGYLQKALDDLEQNIFAEPIRLLKEGYSEDLRTLLAGVLPIDDTSISFSQPNGGMAENLDETFAQMYWGLVEQYIEPQEKSSRDDSQVWRVYQKALRRTRVFSVLDKHIENTSVETFEFDHAWKNGRWNALQPLSFDLVNPGSLRPKARAWLGAAHILDKEGELGRLVFLLGRPKDKGRLVEKAYGDARKMLADSLVRLQVQLVEEDEASDFANELDKEVHDH